MLAFHSTSTAPFFAKNKSREFKIENFDLYCIVLSALLWRKYNGEIIMLADNAAFKYYKKLGLEKIWNDIIVDIPDDLEGINPIMFWAAGKLLALRSVNAPCVMLDMDFLVWKKLDFNGGIIAAHREELSQNVYPPLSYFNMKPDYRFRQEFDENVLPLNTAFLYLPNEDFKQFYISSAIEFMKSAWNGTDFLCYMVFAEQRMLAMCADYLKQSVEVLLDKDKLFYPQESFTHLWGAKQVLRESMAEQETFCRRCAERIKNDFPEYKYVIDIIDNTL